MPLPRISYVNGRYVRHNLAAVHIEDRGYQFADGVYEVTLLINSHIIDGEPHFRRLFYSLGELEIKHNFSEKSLRLIISELARRNRVSEGTIYLQVTRGVAPRNHPFPKNHIKPSLIVTIHGVKTPPQSEYEKGVAVITRQDIRWSRCDIKSISLLPNILAKQEAVKSKAKEVILIRNSFITEGGSGNVMIVKNDGTVHTHPKGNYILDGVTRNVALGLAKDNGIRVHEEAFTREDLEKASEVFLTSTTIGILPVTSVDGKKIGGGFPGKVTLEIMNLYNEHIRKEAYE